MDGRRTGAVSQAKLSFIFSTSPASRNEIKPRGKELPCRAQATIHNGPGLPLDSRLASASVSMGFDPNIAASLLFVDLQLNKTVCSVGQLCGFKCMTQQ